MADKPWKRTEREIAKLIGGERVPITGRQRGDAPDVRHASLSVEVKHRRLLPAWICEAVLQAVASAEGEQLPVAILHAHRIPHSEDLIVMRLADFQKWFGLGANESESEVNNADH